ncbi:putative Late nodulin [Medicago truncatula]|uniref:Nodule Cysteine-Rich (NCR) secreted peptide n=1 Tax=Medicago truncatula TaxID=3880 RepID=A0A072V478_MEDTR|nr:Nodule Cysteine-Rich (NCR) secreted peptide [Medicago truncatula]RHN72474.1 putative Late nodulin [Medicago truncatula]
MAKSLKFFYILISFVSLYFGVVNSHPCLSDHDCYIQYPKTPFGHMECYKGSCRPI